MTPRRLAKQKHLYARIANDINVITNVPEEGDKPLSKKAKANILNLLSEVNTLQKNFKRLWRQEYILRHHTQPPELHFSLR